MACPTTGIWSIWARAPSAARALVIAEATAVSPEGRITPGCTGFWNDEQAEKWRASIAFMKQHGAVPGIQIAHAGRKASANRPWEGDDHMKPDDPRAWHPIGPSRIAFGANLPRVPHEMTKDEIVRVQNDFVAAAKRALAAGFEWLELHFAHGYLAQSFFSPIANKRTDEYGGSFENRMRFLIETLTAVRAVWPEHLPLTARLGVCDFTEDSQPLEEIHRADEALQYHGLDLIDVSLGFNTPDISGVPWGPGVHGAVRRAHPPEAEIPTACGWFITDPRRPKRSSQRGRRISSCWRTELDDPHLPYHAARALNVPNFKWTLPAQYAHWIRA